MKAAGLVGHVSRPSAASRKRMRQSRRRTEGTPWLRMVLITGLLYVAGVLVPLAAWVFAVQRRLVETAWSTGNLLLFALALAAAAALGLFGWLRWLARRV